MKFKEVVARLTGFSIPIFGVSWNPAPTEVTVARKVITFLEDRRVLYNPYYMEDPRHCILSVIEIRQFLTKEIGRLTPRYGLRSNLQAMRAACRKFLDSVRVQERGRGGFVSRSLAHDWEFMSALGEMRGVIGLHIATLAAQHGLNVEGELESILPTKPSAKDG